MTIVDVVGNCDRYEHGWKHGLYLLEVGNGYRVKQSPAYRNSPSRCHVKWDCRSTILRGLLRSIII